jgi:alginate O-acetyltransferase complex protein AlgI
MLFNSYPFALLVLITLGLFYWPALSRFQSPVLIASSLVFYGYGQPGLLALLLASIAINTVCSFRVARAENVGSKRTWAIAGVALNLAILLFFKYSPLLARLLRLDYWQEGSIGHFLVHIPLPVGISFFTFQGISLVVDVFRQKPGDARQIEIRDFRSYLLETALFKTFFPQLVAGPIVKAHDFYPQIATKYFRDVPWETAFRALVLGYFFKMVVADNLKDLTFWLSYPQFLGFPTLSLLVLLFGYSMQIFADFAGYSLIAIGTARLFGYELMQNFNFPYISQSLSEFWRRWHISLSTWLKEYLYIPLGGNRRGEARTYANLIIVMLLGGLWHGAAYSYAVWGLFHGVGLALERFVTSLRPKRPPQPPAFSWIKVTAVFLFVTAAWLLFKLPNIRHFFAFFEALANNTALKNDPVMLGYILLYSAPVILWHVLEARRSRTGAPVLSPQKLSLGYAACLCAIILNSGSAGAFIYFQF